MQSGADEPRLEMLATLERLVPAPDQTQKYLLHHVLGVLRGRHVVTGDTVDHVRVFPHRKLYERSIGTIQADTTLRSIPDR